MEITSSFQEYIPETVLSAGMDKEPPYQERSSRSSLCREDRLELDYVIFYDEGNSDDRNVVHFIPTEEENSDCPTFLDNANQTSISSNSSLNDINIMGELGQNSRSVNRKMSSENYLPREDGSKASSYRPCNHKNCSMCLCKFNLPRKRASSKPQLNTPEEIRFIEENVRANNMLANVRYSWSSDSFLSDDGERFAPMDDSDDDMCYRRITSEYPLMFPLQTPSDGSLVAVIDFDISDEMAECSTKECSHCIHE